jgi:hypothetical protein
LMYIHGIYVVYRGIYGYS